MIDVLSASIAAVFQWQVLLTIVVAAFYGVFVGSIPGLTATMAVALMVPLTFFMSDVEALAAIVTTVTCTIFAGDIPATLVRIPGTPASAAYASDAYALTQKGLAEKALGMSLVCSVLGGLFGTVVLAGFAPLLARFATEFTSYEYLWLYVLGLTCAVIVSDQSRLKGVFALGIGLLLSTVGLGTDFSTPRLTFGRDELIAGVNFIPAMIGLFGISEVLRNALVVEKNPDDIDIKSTDGTGHGSLLGIVGNALPFAVKRPIALLRSSVIGSTVGMLPGAGADIAAWISYAVSKRFSRTPTEYGKGSIEGIADASGANNAALGAAWIPALVFGIPGDSVTAIAIGVLLMKNITPGPNIFDFSPDVNQSPLVLAIFIAFVLANLILVPVGLLAVRTGSILIRIPRRILLPIIVLFCVVGSYAMQASYFDVMVMLVMGLCGFFLERVRVPLGPVVLGIILGGQVEHRFIQCISKSSELTSFFPSWISIFLLLVCSVLWFSPMVDLWRKPRASGQ